MSRIKLLFMGRKQSAAKMLQWSVAQGFDVVGVVTDSHLVGSPTACAAKEMGLPIFSLEDACARLANEPTWVDLAVSYLFWRKLRSPVIDIPQLGCINFHPAPLPDYRGLGGYNIAILNKLTEWGASAHYVDAEIDTGAVIDVFRFSFDYHLETAFSLEKKTLEMQENLYQSVLSTFMRGERPHVSVQPTGSGVYINKAQMLNMMKLDLEHDDIDLKIQACWFPPYSGAYIEVKGQKYTLVNDFILQELADNNQTFQK